MMHILSYVARRGNHICSSHAARTAVGIVIVLCITWATSARAQNNAGIGTTTPNASAQLDLTSTTQGVLLPRLTQSQMLSIPSPATGLLIYNSTAVTFYYYDGTVWRPILSTLNAWSTTGNSGTIANTNFIGTTDSVDFRVRTNNTSRITISAHGFIGIGTTSPARPVEVIDDAPTNVHTAAFRSSTGKGGVACGALGSVTTFGSVQAYQPGAVNSSAHLAVQTMLGGRVGVKTQTPKVLMDINGDADVRDTSLILSSGTNNNVFVGLKSFDRITGPGSNFTITGVNGGVGGKLLILYNTTSKNLTITNEDVNSTAGNRIYTLSGGSQTASGTSSIVLIYSASDSHWHLLSVVN